MDKHDVAVRIALIIGYMMTMIFEKEDLGANVEIDKEVVPSLLANLVFAIFGDDKDAFDLVKKATDSVIEQAREKSISQKNDMGQA